jgi:hypothetical protein
MGDGEPHGINGDCFWVLGMYGGGPMTAAELHGHVALENGSLGVAVPDRQAVFHALQGLWRRRPPLVDREGRAYAPVWRISAHGRAMIDVWAGPLDDGPVRVPCGLGWPGSDRTFLRDTIAI